MVWYVVVGRSWRYNKVEFYGMVWYVVVGRRSSCQCKPRELSVPLTFLAMVSFRSTKIVCAFVLEVLQGALVTVNEEWYGGGGTLPYTIWWYHHTTGDGEYHHMVVHTIVSSLRLCIFYPPVWAWWRIPQYGMVTF
jgi:hypothetical protein